MQYLNARLAGQRVKFPLPLRRFRKLNIVSANSTLHFDDKVWLRKNKKAKTPSDIEITVKPSALVILQPGLAEHELAWPQAGSRHRDGRRVKQPPYFGVKSPERNVTAV
jgi:hypothetical protein